jgi:glycosyltransferase involved in cell wall biosynthesis
MSAHAPIRQPCTILLPLFNGASFLDKCIQNLLEMSSPGDEILIVDDGSTDLTEENISRLKKSDPRINFIRREHMGLVDTLNFGLQRATHELVARADVDDLYAPNRLTLQVKFLEANPRITAVFTDYRMVDEFGVSLGIYPSAVTPGLTAFSLISSQRTAHPSVLFRKTSVIDIGGYQTEDFPAEDLALWIRLLQHGSIASIPSITLNYRVHRRSITNTRQVEMRKKSLDLRRTFANQYPILNLLTEINTLLLEYNNLPYRNLRILYLIHDLLNFNLLTEKRYQRRIYKVLMQQIIVRNFSLIPSCFYILFMKYKKFRLK